jgi:hypothetical protein
MLTTAVENGDDDKPTLLAVLLSRPSTLQMIDKEMITFAAANGSARTVKLLLEHAPISITISEEIVLAAAENWNNGLGVIDLLLEYMVSNFQVPKPYSTLPLQMPASMAWTLYIVSNLAPAIQSPLAITLPKMFRGMEGIDYQKPSFASLTKTLCAAKSLP